MTIESDYVRAGSMGPGPSTDAFKCKKCFCLVARFDRHDHSKKMHPVKTRLKRSE